MWEEKKDGGKRKYVVVCWRQNVGFYQTNLASTIDNDGGGKWEAHKHTLVRIVIAYYSLSPF